MAAPTVLQVMQGIAERLDTIDGLRVEQRHRSERADDQGDHSE